MHAVVVVVHAVVVVEEVFLRCRVVRFVPSSSALVLRVRSFLFATFHALFHQPLQMIQTHLQKCWESGLADRAYSLLVVLLAA